MNEKQIDEYLNQFRAKGIDNQTIEIYKQQIIQSANSTQEMYNFVERVNMHTTHLTDPEQWAIACGANLAYINKQPLNIFKSGLEVSNCSYLLSNWWNINNREELFETLEWLAGIGDRDNYEHVIYTYFTLSVHERERYIRDGGILEEEVADILEKIKQARKQFVEDGLIETEQPIPNTMIWDYARIINLCRFGLDCGYLEEAEVSGIILYAAKKIKPLYNSWKELGTAYVFSRSIWNGLTDYQEDIKRLNTLLSDANSPWVTLKWNIILS
jgi:hypothetical protein